MQPVKITRFCVRNSHDEWREANQANKAIQTAATKAFTPATKSLLVKLLNNEGRVEEKRIRQSELGKRCVDIVKKRRDGDAITDQDERVLLYAALDRPTEKPGAAAEDGYASSSDEVVDGQMEPMSTEPVDVEESARLAQLRVDELDESERQKDGASERAPTLSNAVNTDLHGEEGPRSPALLDHSRDTPGDGQEHDTSGSKHQSEEALARSPGDESDTGSGVDDGSSHANEGSPDVNEDDLAETPGVDSEDDPSDDSSDTIDSEDEDDDRSNFVPSEKSSSDDSDSGGSVVDGEEIATSKEPQTGNSDKKRFSVRDILNEDEEYNATAMTKKWKKVWRESLNDDQKASFDQNLIYTMYICTLDETKTYTLQDLDNESDFCLEWALRLLNPKRFGQQEANLRVVPHINYSGLGNEQDAIIREAIEREKGMKKLQEVGARMRAMGVDDQEM